MVTVRDEEPADFAAVEAINSAAFEREGEAILVRSLRGRPGSISLVASDEGVVVGHLLFSSISMAGHAFEPLPLGLGPMSVRPERQRQEIGSMLATAAIDRCRDLGVPFVVVLGHPDFYPRFGFVPASRFGLRCRWPVPDDVFMAQELVPGALTGVSGLVEYAPEFSRL